MEPMLGLYQNSAMVPSSLECNESCCTKTGSQLFRNAESEREPKLIKLEIVVQVVIMVMMQSVCSYTREKEISWSFTISPTHSRQSLNVAVVVVAAAAADAAIHRRPAHLRLRSPSSLDEPIRHVLLLLPEQRREGFHREVRKGRPVALGLVCVRDVAGGVAGGVGVVHVHVVDVPAAAADDGIRCGRRCCLHPLVVAPFQLGQERAVALFVVVERDGYLSPDLELVKHNHPRIEGTVPRQESSLSIRFDFVYEPGTEAFC